MTPFLTQPWPWYIVGPLIGIMPALLLLLGNKLFGLASNLRHACAAVMPRGIEHFRYDWREKGGWNLALAAGIVVGGFIGGLVLANPEPVAIAESTRADLSALGISDFTGLVPRELFSWESLLTLRGVVVMVGGGFLVGFGTAYGGGCTSGHALTGVADLQPASFVAMIAFFVGGIVGSFLILPLIL